MEARSVELLVEKIEYLEKSLGFKASYEIYSPVNFNPNDIVEIQKVIKRMAEFIGLSDYTFIVSKVYLNHDVGARIELNEHSKEVYVELSNNVVNSCEVIQAALAHELSHKYIQLQLAVPSKWRDHNYENEILTDVTAIFIGFGKLIINGCYEESYSNINLNGRIQERVSKTRMGYLTQEQYAFAYGLICSMRNINAATIRSGLNGRGIYILDQVMKSDEFGYFRKEYSDENYMADFLSNIAMTNLKVQLLLEETNQKIELLIDLLKSDVSRISKEDSLKIQEQKARLEKLELADIYDPALKYLYRVSHGKKAFENRMLLRQSIDLLEEYNDKLDRVIDEYKTDTIVKRKLEDDEKAISRYKENVFIRLFDKFRGPWK